MAVMSPNGANFEMGSCEDVTGSTWDFTRRKAMSRAFVCPYSHFISPCLRGHGEKVPIFHPFEPAWASLGLSEVAEGLSGRLEVRR